MATLIKNCGLKTSEAIVAAANSGASFVGFVHHPASPRHLETPAIAALFQATPLTVKRVIVLSDPDNALLEQLPRPDYWQIHEQNNPARLSEIRAITGVPLIAAVRVHDRRSLEEARDLEDASAHLLFDAPKAGSGKAFDWKLLQGLPWKKSWFLAGGLTIANVAEAIGVTGAPMVDVSSGIESSPGVKSAEMIAAFNAAVLQR